MFGRPPRRPGKIMCIRRCAAGCRLLFLPFILGLLTTSSARAFYNETGGDDVRVAIVDAIWNEDTSIDIAENGDIYIAVPVATADGHAVHIYRSQDAGDSWFQWGVLDSANVNYDGPAIHVAEGTQNRLYVACIYQGPSEAWAQVRVAWSPLSAATATWTQRTALSSAGTDMFAVCITSDEMNFLSYRLYLAATGSDGNGHDIWFTRSADYGASWEAGYQIATRNANGHYAFPCLAYGRAGVLHCTWEYWPDDGSGLDRAVRYRRALNYATGGLADWDATVFLTSNLDGFNESHCTVAASHGGDPVLISVGVDSMFHAKGTRLYQSDDAGATWPAGSQTWYPWHYAMELLALPGTAGFSAASHQNPGRTGFQSSTEAAPMALSDMRVVMDRYYQYIAYGYAAPRYHDYNLAKENRCGTAWTSYGGTDPDTVWFDAEWRGDPGYPNIEDGFPKTLTYGVISPPALCELDGDAASEIVFGDEEGRVVALNHDGSSVPGWPKDIGLIASDGTIAVGDITGNGNNEVVAGNTTGRVYAWSATGGLLAGWSKDLGTAASVYVAIGAISTPQRQVVAVSGTKIYLINGDGTTAAGFPVTTGTAITAAPAIGDLDNDGDREIVIVQQGVMDVIRGDGSVQAFRNLTGAGQTMSNAPTLADLDLDGDREIVVPTDQGRLYVLNPDGTDFPGSWPWIYGAGNLISSAALCQIRSTYEPEIIFNVENSNPPEVHALYQSGTELSGFPHDTGTGWFLYADPIADVLDEGSPDVVTGSRDRLGYAWTNYGVEIPGWPKELTARNNVSPASGDIDGDGRLELVYTTYDPPRLIVMDLGAEPYRTPSTSTWWWPMYGYNAMRQGCLSCDGEQVTGVPQEAPPVGPIVMAAPTPNPAGGPVTIAFTLPEPAAVRLDLFDVQGRLVRRLLRNELSAGDHAVIWDQTFDGRAAPAGIYYARLRVDGPTVSREMNRKIVTR